MNRSSSARKIVVGVTGASGAPYARRLIECLAVKMSRNELEMAIVLSSTAPQVWALECGGAPSDLGVPVWSGRNYNAPFASGSAGWDAMVVIPCSMGTLARIAHGTSETLLTRAADVMVKERRSLIVVPRESPLSVIHLENMLSLARSGATILPAMPSFYGHRSSVDDLVDTVVSRVLDHLGLDGASALRWGPTNVPGANDP